MSIFDIYVLEVIGLNLGYLAFFLVDELPDLIRKRHIKKVRLMQKKINAQIETEKRHQCEKEREELRERVLKIKEWEKKTSFKDESKERN